MQVVVVDEGDAPAELRIKRLTIHALEMMLADLVGGMRFAGEDDLHGPSGRIENPREALGVLEDQVRPFVPGEPAREPDRQGVGLEQRAGGDDARRADALFGPALARAVAHEGEQIPPKPLPHGP